MPTGKESSTKYGKDGLSVIYRKPVIQGMIAPIHIQISYQTKKLEVHMAKVHNNIITQGLSGTLGRQVVFRSGKGGQGLKSGSFIVQTGKH